MIPFDEINILNKLNAHVKIGFQNMLFRNRDMCVKLSVKQYGTEDVFLLLFAH